MRILLLDDNLMSAHRAAGAWERLGHEVTVDTKVPEGPVELAVVNLGSRSLDGLGLVKALKSDRPELRVVGFCGHLETAIRQAARQAGVDVLTTNSSLTDDPQRFLSPTEDA